MEMNNTLKYTMSTSVQEYGNLQSLYSEPQRSNSYKLKVARLALILFVTPIALGSFNVNSITKPDSISQIKLTDRSYSSIQHFFLGAGSISVPISSCSAWWQRGETNRLLYKSFYDNFSNGQPDIFVFMPLFKELAGQLCQLTIKDVFVDVSHKKRLIDFNLNLEKDIFLSVAKRTDEFSDDVMFSIARNHQTLVIGEMPLGQLMQKVKDIIMELNAIQN